MSPDPHTRRTPLVDVRAGEGTPLTWAAASFFCVLGCYYVLRPVRETYGAGFSPRELTQSFLWTLAAMAAATPLYSLVVAATPKQKLLPRVDGFFVLNLIGLWTGLGLADDPPLWLKKVFFVWLSVFNLYVVTLFWSVAVDCFTSDQGKRLFGVVAAAGTLGAIAGSQLIRLFNWLSRPLDVLLASAALLVGAIVCGRRLQCATADQRAAATPPAGNAPPARADDPLAAIRGIIDMARSPYLAAIGLSILLASVCATGIYVQMLDLVRNQLPDDNQRRTWFADLNTYQNALTLVGQAFGVSWLMRRLGVGAALGVSALVYLLGFAMLAAGARELWMLGTFDVAQRFANFAFGVPAREVLFTAVAPDEKYRAKALADTVLKRTGDALGAALGQLATAAQYAVWMLPVAAASLIVSWRLGRVHQQREVASR